jgi:hypothetical protein
MTANLNERRIQQNRVKKARRFVNRFLDQMRATGVTPETDRAALEQAIALVRNAAAEQWVKLAEDMDEDGPPSPATQELILAELQGYIERLDQVCRICKARPPAKGDYACLECAAKEVVEGRVAQAEAEADGAFDLKRKA